MLLFVTKSTVMWYSAQLGEITAGAFVPMLTWAGYILETEGVFEKSLTSSFVMFIQIYLWSFRSARSSFVSFS
jgi:hypothetical protein